MKVVILYNGIYMYIKTISFDLTVEERICLPLMAMVFIAFI